MNKLELSIKWIIDSVIIVKKERFGENFASIAEVIIIKKLIELELKSLGYDVNFAHTMLDSNFHVDNDVITKTNNLTFENEISDEQIRNMIYDKEFIYYCLCQILINKLNNSMEHSCKNCNTLCPLGLFHQSRSKPNNCCLWTHNFDADLVANLSPKERAFLEKEQSETGSLVRELKKDNQHN